MGDKGEGMGQKSQKMADLIYGWPHAILLSMQKKIQNIIIHTSKVKLHHF